MSISVGGVINRSMGNSLLATPLKRMIPCPRAAMSCQQLFSRGGWAVLLSLISTIYY